MEEKYTEQDKIREQYVKLWEKGRNREQILPLFSDAYADDIGDVVSILDWIVHEKETIQTRRDMLYNVLATVDMKENLENTSAHVSPFPAQDVSLVQDTIDEKIILPEENSKETSFEEVFTEKTQNIFVKYCLILKDTLFSWAQHIFFFVRNFFSHITLRQAGLFGSPVLAGIMCLFFFTNWKNTPSSSVVAIQKTDVQTMRVAPVAPTPLPLLHQVDKFLAAEFETEYQLIATSDAIHAGLTDEVILTDDIQKTYENGI